MASFSLSKPGAKEYLIVGGVALGAGLMFFWWKNRQASATAATGSPTSSSSAPSTPTGLSTGDFLAWIHDHTSTTTTTTTSTPSTPSGTTTPTTPNTQSGSGNKEITLQKARSLSSLASEYGVSLATLKSLNPHLGSRVPAGTKVRVPASVAAARR